MGQFIRIEVTFSKCAGIGACGGCVKVCPVNIFEKKGDRPNVREENEDECTLCDLCKQACSPSAIAIHKLYEENGRNEIFIDNGQKLVWSFVNTVCKKKVFEPKSQPT